MVHEFARIAEIRQRLMKPVDGILIGIGDDAAVLAPSDANRIYSVDTQVENVHFRRDWLDFSDIGYRAFVAALSDIAAMGATPQAALIALILPHDITDDQLYTLIDGISEAADSYHTAVIGGNLSSGKQLSISTTVIGTCNTDVLRRSGAQPGDQIYVTGTIGSAALGMRCLKNGFILGADRFISRWKRPVARIAEGRQLLNTAHAMIDVSDGLVQDLHHICEASRVTAEIHSHLLPLEKDYLEIGKKVVPDPIGLALTGGEDYELIFTTPNQKIEAVDATCIGRIGSGDPTVRMINKKGHLVKMERGGYLHFKDDNLDDQIEE